MSRTRPLTLGEQHRFALIQAQALDIRPGTFVGRDPQATLIMSHLTAMPSIPEKARRRLYGNEILQNANTLMPDSQPSNVQFNWRLRELVIQMQELPQWFNILTSSNENLVLSYQCLWYTTKIMGVLGFATLTPQAFATSGIKGGIKGAQGPGGRIRAGVAGAVHEVANTANGGFKGKLGLIWVIGSVTATHLEMRMQAVGRELSRRRQVGKLQDKLFASAFGDDVPMPERFVHWVR